ncbi:MAG: rhodanese-like domain-containing protein [Gammaproteobacteria bacterium]|nr:rhodanese-like domain-containing protein [Gammaproteobacteria bacterium]
MITGVDPKQAWEILRRQPEAVLLDVRSRVEFDYVGHPVGAVHVPWQEFPDWREDPEFVAKVRNRLGAARPGFEPEELPVLAMCRSGRRSGAAGQALERAGFRRVFNIVEGFEGDRDVHRHRGTVNGWRFHGLPWEQT